MVSFTHMGEREKQISCGKEAGVEAAWLRGVPWSPQEWPLHSFFFLFLFEWFLHPAPSKSPLLPILPPQANLEYVF